VAAAAGRGRVVVSKHKPWDVTAQIVVTDRVLAASAYEAEKQWRRQHGADFVQKEDADNVVVDEVEPPASWESSTKMLHELKVGDSFDGGALGGRLQVTAHTDDGTTELLDEDGVGFAMPSNFILEVDRGSGFKAASD
jgi:hypothetical protein